MFEKAVRLADIEQIELMLSGGIREGLVEEYYRFGSIVLSEVQSAGNQIEGKLTALLGLACGMVAFLLFSTNIRVFAVGKIWICSAAAIALVALISAVLGLMTTMWRLPSEADWFKQELTDPILLKKYHVVSLVSAHQQRMGLIVFKSDCLRIAEIFLALSTLVIVAALFTVVLS